jgi:hypothetical protein
MLFETGHDRGYLSRKRRGPARFLALDLLAPSKWGYVSDTGIWAAAMDAYLEDKLEPAAALVELRGLGIAGDYLEFSRILEAELECGSSSEIMRLSASLELETVAAEFDSASSAPQVLAEVERAEALLGVARTSATMVTILLRHAYIPTSILAGGYYVKKSAYGKICIPGDLADDPAALAYAVRRGIAYQIAYDLSEGEACRWLLEATASAVEPPVDAVAVRQLRSDPALWLSPTELEHVFQAESGDDLEACRRACEQAHAVGWFLARRPNGLIECLRAHGRDGPPVERRGYPLATEDAALHVYGQNCEEVFAGAFEALRA